MKGNTISRYNGIARVLPKEFTLEHYMGKLVMKSEFPFCGIA